MWGCPCAAYAAIKTQGDRMKPPKDLPYAKRLRAPFFEHGNTPKRCKACINHCWQLIVLMATLPEAHKQGFICLQYKIFGLREVELGNED